MKSKFLKGISIFLALGMAALSAGCGSSSSSGSSESSSSSSKAESSSSESSSAANGKLDKMTLQLKWLPQSQFMGYYVAKAILFSITQSYMSTDTAKC